MCICHLCTVERSISEAPSYWWVAGLVIAVLVLVLVGVLAYLKVRGEDTFVKEAFQANMEMYGNKTEIYLI